ncbi:MULTISPECIES: alcohol dehydrogenase catalytic domain-containing protein [unclassified Ruegeria]|uniref:zinc-dependent alcohol dehydrogenase n=1 Tax=unclassified Ruegeria TaxID=2625375 RepID=UPI001ADC89BF|nr:MULTISPECIES: alcohol dehydrogenase catalytic domain-containing protein [unclassified Ruegeria]MBO9413525.1 alcohol dehydrogenase catalytic domain-containing protein [Ruegeria sp. R8_1]MBO9417292.1 alcohol dehydrogenase catalytic domain-containing protein [Ruegeria sp. R8_2]
MTPTMRAAVLTEPGRFEVTDVARPNPGRGEVLVRIIRVGICGTDMHIFNGHYAADSLPLIPGHEFTGTIAELGEGVTGLTVGAPVVVDMNIGCGTCYWCRRNEILNCPEMQQMGITMDGAFAEYICVPARLVIPAPQDTAAEVLALTEPLACVVRCARKANITFGQSVVVLGAGPIGNLHVQLLRTIGAAPIIVADLSKARVNMALEVGADVGVTNPDQLEQVVRDHTDGRGADVVIESVGLPALYQQATKLARKGGHIAAFGLTGAGEILPVDILQTILQENSIKGSVAGMGQDMHDALTLLTHGRIKTERFTQATYPLDRIQEAFDSFQDRPADLKTQITVT